MKHACTKALFVAIILFVLSTDGRASPTEKPLTWGSNSYVYAVATSMSHVYFATTGGIIRYNSMEERWEDPLIGSIGHHGHRAKRIWVDRFDQKLYMEAEPGYFEYDLLFGEWFPLETLPPIDTDSRLVSPPEIFLTSFEANYHGDGRFIDIYGRAFHTSQIIDDGTGTLWVGTWGYGPARGDLPSQLIDLLPYGLLQARVSVIMPDDSVLWLSGAIFGDLRTGLSGFDPLQNDFVYIESGLPNALPSTDINALAGDDERIYVGTPLGLFLIERATQLVSGPMNRRRGLSDDNVLALAQMGSSLYVGTAAGLNLIDLATDSVYQIRPESFATRIIYDLETIDSTLWIASSSGAFRFTPTSYRLQAFEDRTRVLLNRVYNLAHDGDYLWLTADAGAVRLNLENAEVEAFRDSYGSADSRAVATADGITALASDFGFTLVYWENDRFISHEVTTDDGLPSAYVYALLFDGDYLWVGTDKGLTLFNWNDPQWLQ